MLHHEVLHARRARGAHLDDVSGVEEVRSIGAPLQIGLRGRQKRHNARRRPLGEVREPGVCKQTNLPRIYVAAIREMNLKVIDFA